MKCLNSNVVFFNEHIFVFGLEIVYGNNFAYFTKQLFGETYTHFNETTVRINEVIVIRLLIVLLIKQIYVLNYLTFFDKIRSIRHG